MKNSQQTALDAMAKRREKSPIDHLSADLDSLVENGLVKTIQKTTSSFGLDGQFAPSKDLQRHCVNKEFTVPLWVEGIRLMLFDIDAYHSIRSGEYLLDSNFLPNAKAFNNHCQFLGNLLQQRDDYPELCEKFLAEIKAVGAITEDFGGTELVAHLTYVYVIRNGNVNIDHCQYNTINPQTVCK